MATDQSPIKISAIVATALVSVVILFFLQFIFRSYFISMVEEETARKLAAYPPTQLNELREKEKQFLTSGSMPITRAMQEMAQQGRDNVHAPNVDIIPEASTDDGPLIGWALTARDAGLAPRPSIPPAEGESPGDAGAAAVGAGDASPALAADAAAPSVPRAPLHDAGPHGN